MIRVGILGLGFMGKQHFEVYQKLRGARVTAICDQDKAKLRGDWSGIGGNIGEGGALQDLSGIHTTSDLDELLADPTIDVIDITLPLHLHLPFALRAFKAGKHVICEKPMALNSREGKRMIAAAERAGKRLFIAHCIRYWPQYAKAREIVQSGTYGQVRSATFKRLSLTPVWGWSNWLMDESKGGSCALEMHIHDTDFILHCFGKPQSVMSSGSGLKPGRSDHVTTLYRYPDNVSIVAEGGWDHAPGFGFEMSFLIVMEKATLQCTSDLTLTLHPLRGKSRNIQVNDGDGYTAELKDFICALASDREATRIKPGDALESLKVAEAELKSIRTGRPVVIR